MSTINTLGLRSRKIVPLLVTLAVHAVACIQVTKSDDDECDADKDCPSDRVCEDGECVARGNMSEAGRGGEDGSGKGGSGGSGNGGSGATSAAGGVKSREEGPEVTCPFPALDANAIMIEELSNPENQANAVLAPWWRRLEFGTRGGLLRAGGIACVPATVPSDNSNAACYDGYDCGGCPMLLRAGDTDGVRSFYFVPEQQKWKLPECAELAGFYGVFAGDKEPTHACDLDVPKNHCLCAAESQVSIYPETISSPSGVICHRKDPTDPRLKSGTNDSCSHQYECSQGTSSCAAALTATIDRATGETTWYVGGSYATDLDACPTLAVPAGEVSEASICPDATAAADNCSSCIDACAGVPECKCDKECASSSYSCAP